MPATKWTVIAGYAAVAVTVASGSFATNAAVALGTDGTAIESPTSVAALGQLYEGPTASIPDADTRISASDWKAGDAAVAAQPGNAATTPAASTAETHIPLGGDAPRAVSTLAMQVTTSAVAGTVDADVSPAQLSSPWQPKSTFTLEADCVPAGKDRVPLRLIETDAEGESIYPWTLDGVVKPSDAGNWTIDVGTHTYSYVVNNNKTGEKSEQGPFTLVVVACEDLVSPVGPTIDDTKQSVEIPEDPNFTYAVKDGEELQPGVHVLGPVGAGNIIATLKPGVSVKPDATTQWPFNFPPQPPKLITPPVLVPIGEHLPIPSMDGVVYVGPDGVVTGTVTLPDGKEQCFNATPGSGDIAFTPGSVTRWCFTYTKPTDSSGVNNGGGTGGGDAGSGATNSDISRHSNSSEPSRTLAATGSSIPMGVPISGAIALISGLVLMLLTRRGRKQVI